MRIQINNSIFYTLNEAFEWLKRQNLQHYEVIINGKMKYFVTKKITLQYMEMLLDEAGNES